MKPATTSPPHNRVNVRLIKVGDLRPNPWNPNRQDEFMFAKEKQSITDHGFLDPVTARKVNGKYQIIDGEHRWRAAKDLGFKAIPVNVLEGVDDTLARKLTMILNALKGQDDPVKLGDLVKELSLSVGVDDLYAVLPFPKENIDSLIRLTEFDFTSPEILKPPDMPPAGWTQVTFLVTADQAKVVEQAVARIVDHLGLEGKAGRGRALELIAADSINTPIESYE